MKIMMCIWTFWLKIFLVILVTTTSCAIIRSLFPDFGIFIPNLFIPVVVFLGFFHQNMSALLVVFLGGLILDMSNATLSLGSGSASLVFLFILTIIISPHFFRESILVLTLACFSSSVIGDIMYQGINLHTSESIVGHSTTVLIRATVLFILTPACIKIFKNILIYSESHVART
jgi:hypothetical protein